VKVDALTVYLQ